MSFWRHYYHLVWGTKQRNPSILPGIEEQLRAYIVSKSAELAVYVYAIGTCEDHIHLVVAIPPKLSVAQVVKKIKGASSHFVNHVLRPADQFAWQPGYGSLSIGQRQRATAIAYVESQKQHHTQQSASAWLEYCCEGDEGPPELARGPGDDVSAVREKAADYEAAQPLF